MRRILIDNARRKATARRGGAIQHEPLDPDVTALPEPREDLLAGFGEGRDVGIEWLVLDRAASSRGGLAAGVVDEDASHRLGRGGEEVAAVVPLVAAGSP